MSHTYHLVCVDCREVLDLGKLLSMDEAGSAIPWTWGGWLDQTTGARIAGASLWKVVEKYMILHRGHELRIIPEACLTQIDPSGELRYVDSASDILGRDVAPEPDDETDSRLARGLCERLGVSKPRPGDF